MKRRISFEGFKEVQVYDMRTARAAARRVARETGFHGPFAYEEWNDAAQTWETKRTFEVPEFHCHRCRVDIFPANTEALTYMGHVFCTRKCADATYPKAEVR